MYTEEIDGIELDISEFSKQIGYRNVEGHVEVKYVIDFPPYTNARRFDTDKEAQTFITQIKKAGDKVKYS